MAAKGKERGSNYRQNFNILPIIWFLWALTQSFPLRSYRDFLIDLEEIHFSKLFLWMYHGDGDVARIRSGIEVKGNRSEFPDKME